MRSLWIAPPSHCCLAPSSRWVVLVLLLLCQTLFVSSFVLVQPPSSGSTPFSTTGATTAGLARRTPSLLLVLRGSSRNEEDGNNNNNNNNNNNPLDFLFNPYESKIPKEVEKDIYEAEGRTAAAQDRGQRIALYSLIAVIGVMGAFFNAFLSELRATPPEAGQVTFDLTTSAFAWVATNPLCGFFFLNKIGGGLLLLLGAGAGLLAESEFDSRRINAEKIWDELQRRREQAAQKQAKKNNRAASKDTNKSKSSLGKKQTKRLAALSEVVIAEPELKATTGSSATSDSGNNESVSAESTLRIDAAPETPATKEGGGLFQGFKDMYDKADAMAASQALLLNKQLEDAGLVDKITDETGLKVIGKEAASKLKQEQQDKQSS